MSTILDEYVTFFVQTAYDAMDKIGCVVKTGLNMTQNIATAIRMIVDMVNTYNVEEQFGIQTKAKLVQLINFIVDYKVCLNTLLNIITGAKGAEGEINKYLDMFTSVTRIQTKSFNITIINKFLQDNKNYIQMAVNIITMIFINFDSKEGKNDIEEMMGYLQEYDPANISPVIAQKIDLLLEAAEQIVMMITTNSDTPVEITLPRCITDKIDKTACGENIKGSIQMCSDSLRKESNQKNPITRRALFEIINEYKPDPSLSPVENNEKRMKLILLIAFILEGYKRLYPTKGGNRRRRKTRRNKSRRVKSRRNRK